ncbi:MAG: pyridoxamine 5'-phosphate oxidase family protein [Chloroflexi bacterium]|nr:MAG: pyridoxamine 5'-phosphate oxidase family protein [Chloroflexota bacterium]TMB96779.1 MAG: pyridoxamine 5'-phosphate oxidase family protein [Chloroflexota bacterium]TMC28602.1 MAG: pyridoxamine 5'-phosphate oxidase family protein [Chloroflexota bacterium]
MASRPRVEQKNLDIYGNKPLPWSRARQQLAAASRGVAHLSYWLATVAPGGRPHSAAVGALWVDDRIYLVSGPRTRKSRNLARDPRCVVSVSLPGLDLVMEGTARRVTDQKTLRRIAARYRAVGWPAHATEGAFTAPYSAPSAGPPPWYLYAVTPSTAFGVAGKKPHGATRWRFKAARRSSPQGSHRLS